MLLEDGREIFKGQKCVTPHGIGKVIKLESACNVWVVNTLTGIETWFNQNNLKFFKLPELY